MQALLSPLRELAEFDGLKESLRKGKGCVALTGCVDSQKLHMIYGLSDGVKVKAIVTYSDLKAREIYEEYRFYDRNVMLYPAKDLIFFQADIHGNQLVRERVRTMRRLLERKPLTIVTTLAALMSPLVLWDRETDVIDIARGGTLDERAIAEKLVTFGYEKCYQVENPGQFSIRGGIIDIFDLTEENPYRIELWGDEVESIRSFDVLSQRSIEKLESVSVFPATEFVLDDDRIRAGLDISNVNTMIIHDSDNMGLSQLYQLRGRVGRSNRTAYAFLMYRRDKMLKEVAEKRLEAIREFTELGSGFKIAMRDLEIRGAGNLLGVRQHGHMEAVGYDMYCKMLNEEVQKLKGGKVIEDFSTLVDLDVDAFIPPTYIVNEVQKLDIYKRIAAIENVRERDDMKDELLDRFGEIPKSVDNLLRIALIRVAAHKLYLTEIKGKNERIVFTFRPDAAVNPQKIPEILGLYGKDLSFTAYGIPSFTYKYKKTGLVETDAELLMDKTEELLEKMRPLVEETVQ